MNYALLNTWCQKLSGADLPISELSYQKGCDIDENLARRRHIGGTSAERVGESIEGHKTKGAALRARLDANAQRWQCAEKLLSDACAAL